MEIKDRVCDGNTVSLNVLRKKILKIQKINRKTSELQCNSCAMEALKSEFKSALKLCSETPISTSCFSCTSDENETTESVAGSCFPDAEKFCETACPAMAGGGGMQLPDGIDPKWDDEQRGIITWPSDKRLLIDAGPGTGKTDVACARVAWLINQAFISPTRIWLISFTQTAVREIRNRIALHLNNPDDIASVRIATLDSHAWTLHSGFDSGAKMTGSYEQNIAATLEQIRADDDVQEYLESLEHLVIDEAQDIVDVRSVLIMELLDKLHPDCGVSIFTDDAQAIYTFSIDEDRRNTSAGMLTLSEKIQQNSKSLKFTVKSLSKIYRTSSPELLNIFSSTRNTVLTESADSSEKLLTVLEEIKANAIPTPNISTENPSLLNSDESTFILYRQRAEALLASAFLGTMPHRIRMSGLTPWIEPWVGACLSQFESNILSRDDFVDLWDSRVEGRVVLAPERDVAWKDLVHIAGDSLSAVDMLKLRMKLGQKRPPRTFCLAEFGYYGPVIGTIHASKGREAEAVRLMLPRGVHRGSDPEEETRVYYVGATRARSRLYVGNSYSSLSAGSLSPSQRVYRSFPGNLTKVQIQVGVDGDIVPESVAGKDYFKDRMLPETIQENLYRLAGDSGIVRVNGRLQTGGHERFLLRTAEGDSPLGFLSDRGFMPDIENIARGIYRKNDCRRFTNIPAAINNIRLFGVRSIVLPPGSPESKKVLEPWSNSGIMLAPVVLGFSTVYYHF